MSDLGDVGCAGGGGAGGLGDGGGGILGGGGPENDGEAAGGRGTPDTPRKNDVAIVHSILHPFTREGTRDLKNTQKYEQHGRQDAFLTAEYQIPWYHRVLLYPPGSKLLVGSTASFVQSPI